MVKVGCTFMDKMNRHTTLNIPVRTTVQACGLSKGKGLNRIEGCFGLTLHYSPLEAHSNRFAWNAWGSVIGIEGTQAFQQLPKSFCRLKPVKDGTAEHVNVQDHLFAFSAYPCGSHWPFWPNCMDKHGVNTMVGCICTGTQ
jgi:hypothetical protein